MTSFYAHTLEGKGEEFWQGVEEHLTGVENWAGKFASHFSAADYALVCARWHDLGKYSEAFQERLHGAAKRVDHKTHGAQAAMHAYDLIGKIFAYPIAGHHGGMPDGKLAHPSDLKSLLKKELPPIPGAPAALLEPAAPGPLPFQLPRSAPGFRLSFFIRMLYSTLVDADFLDTERFMNPERFALRDSGPPLGLLSERLSAHLDKLTQNARDTPVNHKRQEILQDCLDAALLPPGVFSLTVPTGGGKTLSSLAFALKHALEHGLRRVIYVIPYTSIIEQNARVFRDVLGDDAVVEHHSNFSPKSLGKGFDEDSGEDSAEYRRARLAAENWDAPVVVTTNVQFFESLFSNKPSRCRKLHNISKSVIILDEAQMLPLPYLFPCLAALKELAGRPYGASVVLCTATQPNLRKEDFTAGFENTREIVASPTALAKAFERVRFHNLGTLGDEDLLTRFLQHEQALCIVNTRARAAALFRALTGAPGARHLSARMCPEHRSEELKQIRRELEDEKPCLVISTQLIEAGVDVDFPVVYREITGLDSVAQAAGRCNREGRREFGDTFVFTPEQGIPRHFRMGQSATETTLRKFGKAPFSPEAIREYFHEYIWLKGEAQLDIKKILTAFEAGAGELDFPFASVGRDFRLIENEMIPVLIPWDERAAALIDELRRAEFAAAVVRKLQRYTVQIYEQEFSELYRVGGLEMVQGRYPALVSLEGFYDARMGLQVEGVIQDENVFIF